MKIDELFNYGNQYSGKKVGGSKTEKSEENKVGSGKNVGGMSLVEKRDSVIGTPELSESAQNLLEKLRKTYGNKMDFMIYGEGQDPKSLMPYATKEYTVLFSAKELEKMASDEKYEKENMDKILKAVDELEKLGEETGMNSLENGGQITRIGISFDENGKVKLFADMEKSTAAHREKMEKLRQKRSDEKKAADKKAEKKKAAEDLEEKRAEKAESRNMIVKRTTVEADSVEELIEKIRSVNWDDVNEEMKMSGKRINLQA